MDARANTGNKPVYMMELVSYMTRVYKINSVHISPDMHIYVYIYIYILCIHLVNEVANVAISVRMDFKKSIGNEYWVMSRQYLYNVCLDNI